MTDSPLHVVLGAGQIGSQVRELLLARGTRVRQVRRGAPDRAHPLLTHVRGDVSDPAFAEEATRGAAVVYDCTNPAYDRWDTDLFPLARGATHGARKAGAVLVSVDNLYMYGRPSGPLREDSPIAPTSRKGELRARLAEERLSAHARGDVRVVLARGSDWYGPGVTQATVFGERLWQRVFAGKRPECVGDPDMPHAYTYGPDAARALVLLGEREEAWGSVWHVPTLPAVSTREVFRQLGVALSMSLEPARIPRWVLGAMGLFSSVVREVSEMVYQWETPFVVDDSRYRAAFGGLPTPWDDAMAATAAWARGRYGSERAA